MCPVWGAVHVKTIYVGLYVTGIVSAIPVPPQDHIIAIERHNILPKSIKKLYILGVWSVDTAKYQIIT
jgi:hypothetical protein